MRPIRTIQSSPTCRSYLYPSWRSLSPGATAWDSSAVRPHDDCGGDYADQHPNEENFRRSHRAAPAKSAQAKAAARSHGEDRQ